MGHEYERLLKWSYECQESPAAVAHGPQRPPGSAPLHPLVPELLALYRDYRDFGHYPAPGRRDAQNPLLLAAFDRLAHVAGVTERARPKR